MLPSPKIFASFVILLSIGATSHAQTGGGKGRPTPLPVALEVARMGFVEGMVEVQHPGGDWTKATENQPLSMGDRVRTIGNAFLGSTLGCARCHDHKFDPILTRDFYSMGAFFAGIREWGVYADYKYTPEPDLEGVGNDHPFPPEIMVDSPFEKAHAVALRKLQAQQQREMLRTLWAQPGARAAFAAWRTESRKFLAGNPGGAIAITPSADGVSSDNKDVSVELEDGAVVATGPNRFAT
ncbi:MAG: DUF1549 domain-containing protein, partial [Vicinamibacteria bacterium]